MNSEKIQLPDFLIAELYKESLVDIANSNVKEVFSKAEEQPVNPEGVTPASEKIKHLGENEKNVIIIVNQPGAVFLNEDDLIFLTNILKACHLNLSDIAIINLAKQEVDYEAIKEQLNPQTFLLFDVEPSAIKLPFLIPAFQLQKFDGCTIMVAPPLPHLNKPTREGKLLKTKLWMSLKKAFNIP